MSHRGDRDRGDREDRRDRDRGDRRRGDDRDARREPAREREPTRTNRAGDGGLNEFFIDGEGIHREVMQREICKYLGPEAIGRPAEYNGIRGYIVKAVRPFTPKMIEDLKDLSEDYVKENREMTRRGYQGVPYGESQTSRRQDAALQDPYMMETRYTSQPGYSSAPAQGGYPSPASGYPEPSRYPPSQAPGYPQGSGYPPGAGYPQGYPQNAGYPPPAGYPTTSAYATSGYPATAGRPMPNDQNYTYGSQAGDYPPQDYQYGRPGAYASGAQPRDSRAPSGYPYVSSPQDVPMRGPPIDDRYDPYAQPMPPAPSGRGGHYVNSRGTPVYDPPPPQPRDGFAMREPIRDDRRRAR